MRVTVGATIAVENPTSEVLVWCAKNLRLANPEYTRKVRMNLWLGDTPATLPLYEQRGNTLILPFGLLRTLPDCIVLHMQSIEKAFEPAEPVDYGEPVPLYPYQEEAVKQVHAAQYGILQSAAGSGKTQMGIALVKQFGRRALWLTHTHDLLRQSEERASRYMDAGLIGRITAGKVNIGTGITFATIQTMCRLDLSQYKNYWDVIIVDECHRCAGSPTAVSQFSKVLNSLAARHKIGLSATVHRSDGMIEATYALLGRVVHEVPEDAIADKIMKVGIRALGTGIPITNTCMNSDGTLNYARMISYLCESESRNQYIGAWIAANAGHPSLILSDRLEHLEALMNTLPQSMRIQAAMISGKMTTKKGKAEREQAIADMRSGRKKYLFATYALAKEGLDIPCLERLFMTTPQSDYAVITQSIGRVARTCEGKGEPICYDFVDSIPYLFKCYKKRCTTYRKNGCFFIEEGESE